MNQALWDASVYIIPLILAITFHEAAHGYVASKLGDLTAKRLGRVTFDPLSHIDPFGTILLPAMLMLAGAPFVFGYAKPVPVRFGNLRHPRRDALLVALAGPAANLILAYLGALALHLNAFVTPEQIPWTYGNIVMLIQVNIVICVFNLLPILPLDGGRVLNALLPPTLAREHAKSERYGLLIILALFMLPSYLHHPGLFSHYLLGVPRDFLLDAVLHLAGIGTNG